MKKLELSNLDGREELVEVLYHLKELVRSQGNLVDLLKRLDGVYAKDTDETASCLTDIEVEAVDHAGYHVSELRAPLREVVTKAYNLLDEEENTE